MGKLEFKQIISYLDNRSVSYNVMEHRPVSTSVEAAEVRGVELKTGVKALILKTVEGNFILGLVAADRRIDFKRLAVVVGTRKLRMASSEEVVKVTGCEPGCVHPFGNLSKTPIYMDESVLENEDVNFSVGIHTASMSLKSSDLRKIIQPTVSNFT